MKLQQKRCNDLNCFSIRQYFASKYYLKFNSEYPNDKFKIELILLKKQLLKYSQYTVLEAIDRFVKKTPLSKCRISYFITPKVFASMFYDLIAIDDIAKYKRFFPFYGKNKETAEELIQEYESYLSAFSLSIAELERKAEILKILEAFDAERIRTACAVIDERSEILQ